MICLLICLYLTSVSGLRIGSQFTKTHLIRNDFKLYPYAPTKSQEIAIARSNGLTVLPRRFQKSTKQLATLGPASNTFEMIEKLFLAGADVFRLNFSHGEHSEKANIVKLIRAVEKKYDHPIAILGDLQGPKLRVGTFENDKVTLVDGQTFVLDNKDILGTTKRVRLPHSEILFTLKRGDFILFDDGKLRMEVTETTIDRNDTTKGMLITMIMDNLHIR